MSEQTNKHTIDVSGHLRVKVRTVAEHENYIELTP